MNTRRVIVGGRRTLLVLTLTALAVPTAALTSAEAADSGTPCTFEADIVASPGVSTNPSSGSVTGAPEDSTITCAGPVNGKQPTGPGTIAAEGRYGTRDPDTCQSGGEGEAVNHITIPTSDGTERITNKFTFTYGAFKAAGAPFSGSFEGDRMSGTMEVTPIDGDCASKPVTKYHVKGKGTLRS